MGMGYGSLLLENVCSGLFEAPDSWLYAEILEEFKKNWKGRLLPEMRKLVLFDQRKQHRMDGNSRSKDIDQDRRQHRKTMAMRRTEGSLNDRIRTKKQIKRRDQKIRDG